MLNALFHRIRTILAVAFLERPRGLLPRSSGSSPRPSRQSLAQFTGLGATFRVMATALMVALGVSMVVLSVRAQQIPPVWTCGDFDGRVCASGEICLFWICWEYENYWPDGDGGGGSDPGLPEPCSPCWDMTWCETEEDRC